MKLVATREFPDRIRSAAVLPDGNLLILRWGEEKTRLECYDAGLARIWSTFLDERSLALAVADDGTPWVLDPAGASAFGVQGARMNRVRVRTPGEMCVASFAILDDELLFACQHKFEEPTPDPTIMRVTNSSEVRWSTALPVGPLAYEGVTRCRADEGWKPRPMDPWMPEAWVLTSTRLTVSEDRVLACFTDLIKSGVGFGYALSLSDGTLRYTTRQGPIKDVAALGQGSFLVGYQGYGAFETLHYGREGRVQTRWPTQGYYAVSGDNIRVIERTNIRSKTNLSRLVSDGVVEKGTSLDAYYGPRPYLRKDGTLFFVLKNALLGSPGLSIEERLELCSANDNLNCRAIVGSNRRVFVAFWKMQAGAVVSHLVCVDV